MSLPVEILTRQETADLLRISLPTLRKAIRQQGLPVIHVGNQQRFRRSAVLAWAEQQEKHGRRSA